MYDVVRAAFRPLSGKLEGVVNEMYVDILNLVTTGVGNLIDASRNPNVMPWSPALQWEWRDKATGMVATRDQVVAEWNRVKNAGHQNWRASAQAAFGRLALTDAEMERLFEWRLDEDEKILARRFPEWSAWGADAQMGTFLVDWWTGPGFTWPNFTAALKEKRFADAAMHGQSRKMNANRNAAIKGHFEAAAVVHAQGLPRERLHFQYTGG